MALKPHNISWHLYTPKPSGSRIIHSWFSWCWTAGGLAPQCHTLESAWCFSYISMEISLLSAVSSSCEWLRAEGSQIGSTALCIGKAWEHYSFSLGLLERCRTISAVLMVVETLTWTWSGACHFALGLAGTKSFRQTFEKYLKSRVVGGNYISDWNPGVVCSNLSQNWSTDFWMHDQTS